MTEQKKSRNRRRGRRNQSGYIHKSPAVCVVVHDPSGRTMPQEDADAIIESIFELVSAKGYLINFTRT